MGSQDRVRKTLHFPHTRLVSSLFKSIQPIMKTKTYSVYSFSELSPKAREKAIDNHRLSIREEWDGEQTIEDAKNVFGFAGFDISKVYYSGFSSQGDGACFEGSWYAKDVNPALMRENAPKDAELHRIADELKKLAEKCPEARFSVKHRGHYFHEYCTDFSFDLPEPDLSDTGPYATGEDASTADQEKITIEQLRFDRANDDLSELEKELTELSRNAMRWIYKQLEKEYDWQTADKQVIESIKSMGYEFTEEGEID